MGFTFQIGDLGILISVALMALGVRLIAAAAQNRSAPELLIGLYLLISPPSTSLAMRVSRFHPVYHDTLDAVAIFGITLAGAFLTAFAWRVFRPEALWAKCAAAIAFAYYGGLWTAMLLGVESLDVPTRALLTRIALLGTYIWLFVECLLQRRQLERRMRLGLADPVVANRFLLFAIWSGTLAVLPGLMLMAVTLLRPAEGATSTYGPVFAVLVRITGFAMYGAMWLSFLPPRAYVRWVERRYRERFPDVAPQAAGA